MRVTVFTSNQPRHIALIEALAGVAEEVLAIQECCTVYPGRVDDLYRQSPVMQDYFSRVTAAEAEVFGRPRFAPANVRQLPIRMGDINQLEMDALSDALTADAFIVFGASFIRGPLCDQLVARRAVNIHMGVSPHYRGSGTNFWAMYDRRADLVGATIHLLTRGLDSGPMLFHALPPADAVDPFVHGMRAVRAAHAAVVHHLKQGTLLDLQPAAQDKARQLRYSRHTDFTDQVAAEYLTRLPTASEMRAALSRRDMNQFHRPQVA
jgi:folate-dependent phosphoribosylglycinamide formyltransferase PurN